MNLSTYLPQAAPANVARLARALGLIDHSVDAVQAELGRLRALDDAVRFGASPCCEVRVEPVTFLGMYGSVSGTLVCSGCGMSRTRMVAMRQRNKR